MNCFNNKKRTNLSVFFNAILNALCIIVFICFVLIATFYFTHNSETYPISGSSMEPTIASSGQCCFVAQNGKITYQDIIIANNPENKLVIKRVIAFGEDSLGFVQDESENWHILLMKKNEEAKILEEDYIKDISINYNAQQNFSKYILSNPNLASQIIEVNYNSQTIKMVKLNENQMFWIGDNRAVSLDCLTYGPQDKSQYYGRADLIVNEKDFFIWKILLYQLGF